MLLSFGNITNLYYSFIHSKTPKQLDKLAEWFPGLLVVERNSNHLDEPEYVDHEYRIYADKDKNGSFYSGGTSNRVTQIVGRLIGTARSNQEKGRKDAELIKKHIARQLITDWEHIESLQNNVYDHILKIEESRLLDFRGLLINTVFDLAEKRSLMSEEEKDNEPFPFLDHVFDDLIYNAAYQLHLYTEEGMVKAYLWLLLGGFLRNEVSVLTNMFHSGFIAINRKPSETGSLLDKLNYMFDPDEYCATYEGDDLDKRFPGITWLCDNSDCEAILDYQPGFDDHLEYWQCRECGHINKIEINQIYENEEDYREGNDPVDPDNFNRALEEQKKNLNNK